MDLARLCVISVPVQIHSSFHRISIDPECEKTVSCFSIENLQWAMPLFPFPRFSIHSPSFSCAKRKFGLYRIPFKKLDCLLDGENAAQRQRNQSYEGIGRG
jgi:hypothetical protein